MPNGTWGGLTDPRPLRVKILFRLGTSRCQTGFHLRRDVSNFSSLQDVANSVNDTVVTPFRQLLTAGDEITAVDVTDIVDGEGAQVPLTGITGLASQLDVALPSFITAPVIFKSSVRRRYGQGRMLLPIRAEADVNVEILSAQGQGRVNGVLNAIVEEYMQGAGVGAFHLINLHTALAAGRPSTSPTPLPAVPASWYDVTSARSNPNVGALRSRKQGIGS